MSELASLGRQLLNLVASRRGLAEKHSHSLVACASVLLHGVVPSEARVFEAVSALRVCGPLGSNYEEQLLALLGRPNPAEAAAGA